MRKRIFWRIVLLSGCVVWPGVAFSQTSASEPAVQAARPRVGTPVVPEHIRALGELAERPTRVGGGDAGDCLDRISGGARSSSIPHPPESDRYFLVTSGPGLDTGCSFSADGPLVITVEVGRYAGPTTNGKLDNVQELVNAGVLFPYAKLVLPAYDVDYNAPIRYDDEGNPIYPERDRVLFNGESLPSLFSGNREYLYGTDERWVKNEFLIPIEKVNFPSAKGNGGPPHKAENKITIYIDVANPGQEWCMSVDWAAIKINIMSPVVLVHGNGSDGGFYERMAFTDGLDTQKILWDNSISMETDTIALHEVELVNRIPQIVQNFGVDSIHVICHSKGGLDTRGYLARFYTRDNPFRILSYTSLSTPHDGSILADLGMTRKETAKRGDVIFSDQWPNWSHTLTVLAGTDKGMPDLRTTTCATFNAANLPALPPRTVYGTVGADADTSGNGVIDNADEYDGLRSESIALTIIHWFSSSVSSGIVNIMYQILRTTTSVVAVWDHDYVIAETGQTISVFRIDRIETPPARGNDAMVAIPSGLGQGNGFSGKVTGSYVHTYTGGAGRDHASVADTGVANLVGPWLINIEREKGDLKDEYPVP